MESRRKVTLVKGTKNGVHCVQQVLEVNDGATIHTVPVSDPFVFMSRESENFQFATGDLELMDYLLDGVGVEDRAHDWPVPLSKYPVRTPGELRRELNGRDQVGDTVEAIELFCSIKSA